MHEHIIAGTQGSPRMPGPTESADSKAATKADRRR